MEISLPETAYVRSSPSASDASTEPISVWFSAVLNVAPDEITGAISLIFVIFTVISCVSLNSPSLTVTVAV